MTSPLYLGIDVSKSELVVASPVAVLFTVPNNRDGHRDLVQRLASLTIAAVVIESTGPYSRDGAKALSSAGIPVSMVQPGRIRHFALSQGILAKTDAIDAKVIATFGAHSNLKPWIMPAAELSHLRALVDRRDQIIEMRKSEQNGLESIADPLVAKEVRRSIARLEKEEAKYDQLIAAHIRSHERLHRLSEALQSESGVALQTAAAVLAHMPEIGTVNRQEAGALVGLAPYNCDSGPQRGKRVIRGGRRRLRRALYMAAITAVRFNVWIKPMYQRLLERGKVKKVALIACGRKLIVRLNSIAAKALRDMELAATHH